VANFGDRAQPLEPNCVKDVTAQVDWNEQMDALRLESREWLGQASLFTMVYAPATQVWQRWVEPGGDLSEMLAPVSKNAPDRAEWVREQCKRWSADTEIDKSLQRTLSEIKRRKRAIRIEARALRQVQSRVHEAVEIAERWLALLESRPDKI